MFKRITDERLLAKNLRNVRIAFIIQTVGIVVILGWTIVSDGIHAATGDPLWLVLLVTMTIFLVLSIPVAKENHEV